MRAFYFDPSSFVTSTPKLMGRQVANAGFLNACLRYSSQGKKAKLLLDVEANQSITETKNNLGELYGPAILVDRLQSGLVSTNVSGIYFPAPDIGQLGVKREIAGARTTLSICGITHTTASDRVADGLANLLTQAVYPWDAVVCTSKAVANHVKNILEPEMGRLRRRLGAKTFNLPQFPIIPLGVFGEQFNNLYRDKIGSRKQLGIADDEIVFLYVGRLSFHAKAHPLGMYKALELAKEKTGKQISLIEAGWFSNDYTQRAFDEAASVCCPSVRIIRVDGRDKEKLNCCWSAADIFTSLSDNFQETFGITPLEAMAAKLPVVVSDWNGYKDTVRNSLDGFLIPTHSLPSGVGSDIGNRYALGMDNYDFFSGHSSTFVSVDIKECADAYVGLIESPELRRKMGESGSDHVAKNFDWKTIIPKYEALWDELDEIRSVLAPKYSDEANVYPTRRSPYDMFAHYPSSTLTLDHTVILLEPSVKKLTQILALEMVNYARAVLPPQQILTKILEFISEKNTVNVDIVVQTMEDEEPDTVLRAILLLAKLAFIKIKNPNP